MAVNGQLVTTSPADELLERLDDPRVAGSLALILDHADLLAMLVAGIHGVFERGDTIANAIADGVAEMRGTGDGGLVSNLAGAAPSLGAVLGSASDPRFGPTVALLVESLVDGKEEFSKNPSGPGSVFGLLRALKDDDVSRGLGLLIQVAKALGRKVA